MESNNKISVILETWFTGHRSEHITYLMKFINSRNDLHGKYLFLLNEKLKPLLGTLLTSSNYMVKYIEVNKKPQNYISKSFWEWSIVSKIISQQGNVGEIIFMDIDSNLILISSPIFKKFNLTVKGILYQPYLHFTDIKGGYSFFIKKVLKNYLFQKLSVFINPNIKKIFILNDINTVNNMNKRIKNVFYNLPDPIDSDVVKVDTSNYGSISEKYGIKAGNKNLLVFGSIDARKNIINIVDALRLLPEETRKKVHLIIAGKIGVEMREIYTQHLEKYKKEVSIFYNNAFVPDDERQFLFENCDLVLLAYIKFYSASGVLAHAITNNKNIVAPNQGLLARIVKENNLGITVDPLKPEEIKEAVKELLENPGKFTYDSKKLSEDYSAVNFSKTILLN